MVSLVCVSDSICSFIGLSILNFGALLVVLVSMVISNGFIVPCASGVVNTLEAPTGGGGSVVVAL